MQQERQPRLSLQSQTKALKRRILMIQIVLQAVRQRVRLQLSRISKHRSALECSLEEASFAQHPTLVYMP